MKKPISKITGNVLKNLIFTKRIVCEILPFYEHISWGKALIVSILGVGKGFREYTRNLYAQ